MSPITNERIDFHNPAVGKPTNLQNSAVLRMLEEEEHRQKSGRAGVKRVAWPPPQEGILDPLEAQAAAQAAGQPQGGYQYPNQSPNFNQNQNNYPVQQQPSQPPYRPLKPLDVSSVGSGSPLASPHVNQSPQGFRPATPSKGWAPVHSPASTPQYQSPQQQFGAPNQRYQSQPQYQPVSQPYQQPGQQYQSQQYQVQQTQQYQSTQYQQEYQTPSQQQYQVSSQHYQTSSQQQYQPQSFAQPPQQPQPVAAQAQAAPRPQAKHVEPPPSTITLRQQAPVSQPSPPVYSAQPATASLKVVVGGRNLRGDLKWPPENVKFQIEEENRQRIELAKGPAFRPKRKDKDYTRFFEEHALNSSYPGYKIPPGTQFYRPL
ncbi:vacuolar protein-sorting-associated protein 36-like isoform X5 [Cylas formicarius]|uniref:vacuolar protein-sorting-associated protein 36-like isoform X5 n=1 Tax=Cylas formicarius TaxID=197179 RepID=UPI00295867F1|nr:vacuolar protein-sorting-associated protein 36-like isoform X5 [Cylas formicarius]